MKKILAILMLLCLFTGVALAEPAEVNWADIEPVLDASGVEGDFYTFDEVAVKIWLPAELQPAELTQEDVDAGVISSFTDANQETMLTLVYVNADGASVEDYATYLSTAEGVTEVALETINGLNAVEYKMPEQDTLHVAFATEAGYLLEFSMFPLSEEGADVVWGMVGASIQPAE